MTQHCDTSAFAKLRYCTGRAKRSAATRYLTMIAWILMIGLNTSHVAHADSFQWPSSCTSNGGDVLCIAATPTYVVAGGSNFGASYSDGITACVSWAGNSYGTQYRNPAFQTDQPQWGEGCWYDLYDEIGGEWVYDSRAFYQHAVLTNQSCPYTPVAFSYTDASDLSVSEYGRLWCGYTPYYVTAWVPPSAQCDACSSNYVGHPIDPASGSLFDSAADLSASLPFERFYNSADAGAADLASGWRHSYGRSVVTRYSTIEQRAYVQSAAVSSKHGDPALACTSGFTQIQSQVPRWSGASVVYSGGNCQIMKNGALIALLWIYADIPVLAPATSPVGYDVIRDDGKLLRFIVSGSSIIAPIGSTLSFLQTGSVFIVTDDQDNVEEYDSSGKLLTVTTRAGTVQTLSYDGSGRLSEVADSFGHALTLGYDTQGRLSGVARQ